MQDHGINRDLYRELTRSFRAQFQPMSFRAREIIRSRMIVTVEEPAFLSVPTELRRSFAAHPGLMPWAVTLAAFAAFGFVENDIDGELPSSLQGICTRTDPPPHILQIRTSPAGASDLSQSRP
jgi:hypothetical protein